MIDKQARVMGELKIGYSRGLPQHLAPKLFTNKKQEEFFVANLYAQMLFFGDNPVAGVLVCENDSNKGADALIKITNGEDISVQITRFVLTNYLQRKNAAVKRVERIVERVIALGKIDIPVNVRIFPRDEKTKMPPDKRKLDDRFARKISALIKEHDAALKASHSFINCAIPTDDPIFEISPLISLHSIPPGHHSNYIGMENVYIDFDFDQIYFTHDDIKQEADAIFSKKTEECLQHY